MGAEGDRDTDSGMSLAVLEIAAGFRCRRAAMCGPLHAQNRSAVGSGYFVAPLFLCTLLRSPGS